jgi:hypothetical protein
MAKTELTGEYMTQMAVEWRNANAKAWELMTDMGRQYVAQGRRFSMEKLLQFARYDMLTNGYSQGFKVNNNTRAALARMMLKENPEFEPYIDVRKSKVDL